MAGAGDEEGNAYPHPEGEPAANQGRMVRDAIADAVFRLPADMQ